MVVDAIVVSFNTKALLRASLFSLRASQHPIRRVYVVDNASDDGSASMVATDFPDATLLEMPRNVGFARANNAAFGQSDADAALLLNPDAELDFSALEKLVAALEADATVGIAGPVLVGDDGLVQFEGGRREPSILGEFGNISHLNTRLKHGVFGRYLMNDWDHRSTRSVEVLSGACMLVRRSAAGESLFCDDYFMYGEDIGLCRRLRGAGWTMRYVGDARVLHHGGAASSQARSRMRVAGVVSMARLLREAHGPVYAAAYLTSVPFAWLLGMILPKERAV